MSQPDHAPVTSDITTEAEPADVLEQSLTPEGHDDERHVDRSDAEIADAAEVDPGISPT